MSGISLRRDELVGIMIVLIIIMIVIWTNILGKDFNNIIKGIGSFFVSLYYTIFVYELIKNYIIKHKKRIGDELDSKDH